MHRLSIWRSHGVLWALLALVLLVAGPTPISARPACHTYSNSGVYMSPQGGVSCGSTGGECTECVTIGPGPAGFIACWSNGWSTICGDPISGYYLL